MSESLKQFLARINVPPVADIHALAERLERLEEVQRLAENGEKIDVSKEEKKQLILLMDRTEFVYFVYAEKCGMIKIGVTGDLRQRLADLQIGSPERLVILSHVRGNYHVEQYLHGIFERERSHGEWFRVSDRLIQAAEIALEGGLKGLLAYTDSLVDKVPEMQ